MYERSSFSDDLGYLEQREEEFFRWKNRTVSWVFPKVQEATLKVTRFAPSRTPVLRKKHG